MNTYILLFGVTGDLSKRMLLPSIEFLLSNKKIENIKIFGVSRRTIDVNEVLNASLGDDYKNSNVAKNIESIVLDSDLEDYIAFKNNLNLKKEDQLLIYLSVPPANALKYVEFLGKAGLNSNNVKLMLEKPFGVDYDSANNFLKIIDTYYNENQVYKIDHYLAKANAQKLINIYRRSETFKHIWNKDFIDKIEVVANESIDIQGRSVFYDQTGALRDFIQGHLFELLLLTICDIDGNTIENRINVAKSLNLVENKAIRGQYIGYEQEVGHSSNIETYASVLLNFNNEKWMGVNLCLRSGKALLKKESYISINFKNGENIRFNISPSNEELSEIVISNKNLNYEYLDGYKAVFYAAINSNKEIFSSNDEILSSWSIFDKLLKNWKENNVGLKSYEKYICTVL